MCHKLFAANIHKLELKWWKWEIVLKNMTTSVCISLHEKVKTQNKLQNAQTSNEISNCEIVCAQQQQQQQQHNSDSHSVHVNNLVSFKFIAFTFYDFALNSHCKFMSMCICVVCTVCLTLVLFLFLFLYRHMQYI